MKTPYPETDDFAEYSNVNRKPTQGKNISVEG